MYEIIPSLKGMGGSADPSNYKTNAKENVYKHYTSVDKLVDSGKSC